MQKLRDWNELLAEKVINKKFVKVYCKDLLKNGMSSKEIMNKMKKLLANEVLREVEKTLNH